MSATSRRNKKKAGKTYPQRPQLIKADVALTHHPRVFLGLALDIDMHDIPAYDKIPDRFKSDRDPFVRFVTKWFHGRAKASQLFEHVDIHRGHALHHLSMVLQSFMPSHEHKMAGAAYLLAQWFDIAEEK